MRLFGTVDGKPAIGVGYGPSKSGPRMIVIMADSDHPIHVSLEDFKLPRVPKKLQRKVRAWVKQETKAAQQALAGGAMQ